MPLRSTETPNCEICDIKFTGLQAPGARMSHLVTHFRKELMAKVIESVPPFKCPTGQCTYESASKPLVIRHYGAVHNVLNTLVKEYVEKNANKVGETKSDNKPHKEESNASEKQNGIVNEKSMNESNGTKDEYKCSLCSFKTNKQLYVAAHFTRQHPDSQNPFRKKTLNSAEGMIDLPSKKIRTEPGALANTITPEISKPKIQLQNPFTSQIQTAPDDSAIESQNFAASAAAELNEIIFNTMQEFRNDNFKEKFNDNYTDIFKL